MSQSNTTRTGNLLGYALGRLPPTGLNGIPWNQVVNVILVLAVCTWLYFPTFGGISAPFAGYRHPLEPKFFVQLRFKTGAASIISEGYSKVTTRLTYLSASKGINTPSLTIASGKIAFIELPEAMVTWLSCRANTWMNYRMPRPSG